MHAVLAVAVMIRRQQGATKVYGKVVRRCSAAALQTHADLIYNSPQGSAKVYAEECAASPCFSINFADPAARRTSYVEFRKLNSKWQHKLGKVGSCRCRCLAEADQPFTVWSWHPWLAQTVLHCRISFTAEPLAAAFARSVSQALLGLCSASGPHWTAASTCTSATRSSSSTRS